MKSGNPKEDAPQKVVVRVQYEPRISKTKKVLLPITNKQQAGLCNYEEAKASCKLRKRKERQESVSSISQERKVIRSSSEERPILIKTNEDKNSGIRRVSSSGDFPKSIGDDKSKSPIRKSEQLRMLKYDDNEHDRARSHERFSRSHNIRSKKHPNRRYKARATSKVKLKNNEVQDGTKKIGGSSMAEEFENIEINQENEETNSLKFLNLPSPSTDRSPSPTNVQVTPILDFASLYEQPDGSEPLISQPVNQVSDNMETMPGQSIAFNKMLSSPRNSIIATTRIYLDPNVPQVNIPLKKVIRNPVEERIEKLTKQINKCKKKILACESEFEARTGAKSNQFDKMNDNVLRKQYLQLSKLKREQKNLTDISMGFSGADTGIKGNETEENFSLQETIRDIEERLQIKRETAARDCSLDHMTPEQLVEEKIATQKALLFLESVHGRPRNKQDRDMVRPFYDRYRTLKQMVLKCPTMNNSSELATIDENEAMHFVTSTSSSNETESDKIETPTGYIENETYKEVLKKVNFEENLHSLTKPELLQQMGAIIEEKRELRRKIKEFEKTVQTNLGRMLTKEDKKPVEEWYMSYKRVKGRLRLIEALVGKY
ncbi:protein FAM13A [Euwallacea similis]|uniref:protein FAM13A n=1 Tax=Euwallacea similis TaxID=1736056 RepID=UPI00344E8A23